MAQVRPHKDAEYCIQGEREANEAARPETECLFANHPSKTNAGTAV